LHSENSEEERGGDRQADDIGEVDREKKENCLEANRKTESLIYKTLGRDEEGGNGTTWINGKPAVLRKVRFTRRDRRNPENHYNCIMANVAVQR